MHEPLITIVGNVAWPPRQRTLASGTIVADFRVANTPRNLDKATGQWTDGQTIWFGVTCWRALAENAAVSLKKGDRVVVTGRLSSKSWTTEQGEERTGFEIDAVAVGVDLSRGPVTQERPERKAERSSGAADTDEWQTPEVAEAVPAEAVAA